MSAVKVRLCSESLLAVPNRRKINILISAGSCLSWIQKPAMLQIIWLHKRTKLQTFQNCLNLLQTFSFLRWVQLPVRPFSFYWSWLSLQIQNWTKKHLMPGLSQQKVKSLRCFIVWMGVDKRSRYCLYVHVYNTWDLRLMNQNVPPSLLYYLHRDMLNAI